MEQPESTETAQLTKQQEATGVSQPADPPPAADYSPPPTYGTSDTVPPSYEESHGDAPPPSYESLYGNLKKAKSDSSGFGDFVKRVFVIVLGTLGCTVCVGLLLAIPITMIVIGSIHLHNCPVERYIPIYLIVAGVFGVVKNLSNLGQRIKNRKEEQDEENSKTNPFDGLVSCFLFAWFIAGNVWIYRVYSYVNTSNSGAANYCDPTLYFFAFWITTATYILIGLSCFCMCCAVCAGAAAGGKK